MNSRVLSDYKGSSRIQFISRFRMVQGWRVARLDQKQNASFNPVSQEVTKIRTVYGLGFQAFRGFDRAS